MASHDLRNPLATLRGFLDLVVEEEELSEFGSHLVGRALDVADRMRLLVDAIGTYGRARRLPLARDPVELDEVLATARAGLAAELDVAHASFEVEQLPTVLGDLDALVEVVRHVLDNAVRYVEPDATPVVRVAGSVGADGVVLRVDDHGPGLPDGTETSVFEPFSKTINSRGHNTTGLGLATSRVFVERMGGTIGASAGPGGAGTRITITLPSA